VKKIAALVLVACGSASPSPKPQATTPPVASSAQAAPTTTPTASAGATFDEEVAFLRAHGAKVEIVASGTGHIAIAPDYQLRVMTSEVAPHGRSLGFVHHAFIEAGKHGTQFDNYGGEDRFWLGPEGGQWGLYFPPGAKYEFGLWQTPHDLQEGAMKRVAVTNHLGTKLEVEVERHIDVAPTPTELPAGVTWVGFTSRNVITNRGARPISDKDGLISIWILGMYAPAPDTKIIVPFGKGDGPTVNDRYFGKVPAERLVVHDAELVEDADRIVPHHAAIDIDVALEPARAEKERDRHRDTYGVRNGHALRAFVGEDAHEALGHVGADDPQIVIAAALALGKADARVARLLFDQLLHALEEIVALEPAIAREHARETAHGAAVE